MTTTSYANSECSERLAHSLTLSEHGIRFPVPESVDAMKHIYGYTISDEIVRMRKLT